MTSTVPRLDALRVEREASVAVEIAPPKRWLARYVFPMGLLLGFAGLAGWSSWSVLWPGRPVTILPVVVREGPEIRQGQELFSATGWIEPAPTPIEVAALTEGVLERLNYLPGQRVEAGAVVAQLVDVDARLQLRAAEEDLAACRHRVAIALADVGEAEAQLRAAEAALRADEQLLADRLIGKVKFETTLAQRGVAAARLAQAQARLAEAQGGVRQAEVRRDVAQLRLDRTQVRAPCTGVVMSLHATPGRTLGARAGGGHAETVMTLYDPMALQVRVEVPMDKFRLVRAGQLATLEVDVAEGERLAGVVLYDTHETDVNRNTVRVKVAVLPPLGPWPPLPVIGPVSVLPAIGEAFASVGALTAPPQARLRPGMIAKVRVFASLAREAAASEIGWRILAPRRLIAQESGQSLAWIVDAATQTARRQPVVLGPASLGEWVEIVQGLQPSDKLIDSGREGLRPGARVKIVGYEP